MHAFATIATFVLACASLAAAGEDCSEASARCNFFFEGSRDSLATFGLCGTADNGPGFTTAIKARNGDRIGTVNSAAAVEYLSGSGFSPLPELDSQLGADQFATFADSGEPKVGHRTFQGDSRRSVQGQCIRVPFSSWQVLDKDGNVVRNVTDPSDRSCVVFAVGSCDGSGGRRGARRSLRGVKNA